jgi:FlaA1/EpsC-like NDP-sugar epimerase
MTIPEAAHLILQAASLARPADLFVLDMGEPVRVLDLARDVIRLSGQDWSRARIEFIGLRPGEKLHESLFYDSEAVEPTEHPKIRRVAQKALATSPRLVADELLRLAESGDEFSVRLQLMDAVRSEGAAASPRPWTAYPIGSPATRAHLARSGASSIAHLP